MNEQDTYHKAMLHALIMDTRLIQLSAEERTELIRAELIPRPKYVDVRAARPAKPSKCDRVREIRNDKMRAYNYAR